MCVWSVCGCSCASCVFGALKRNENHFLCMHATKYANTNNWSQRVSRAICLHHQPIFVEWQVASCKLRASSGAGKRNRPGQAASWRQPPQPEIGSLIISEQNATGFGFGFGDGFELYLFLHREKQNIFFESKWLLLGVNIIR